MTKREKKKKKGSTPANLRLTLPSIKYLSHQSPHRAKADLLLHLPHPSETSLPVYFRTCKRSTRLILLLMLSVTSEATTSHTNQGFMAVFTVIIFHSNKCTECSFCIKAFFFFLPPPHSQRVSSLKIPHANLHSSSDPSFISHPCLSTPLPHFSLSPSLLQKPIVYNQRSGVKLWWPQQLPLQQKSASEKIQHQPHSYFSDNGRQCQRSSGAPSVKSPVPTAPGWKTETAGGKILSVSYHFPQIVRLQGRIKETPDTVSVC